jgi:hypothetical protein
MDRNLSQELGEFRSNDLVAQHLMVSFLMMHGVTHEFVTGPMNLNAPLLSRLIADRGAPAKACRTLPLPP